MHAVTICVDLLGPSYAVNQIIPYVGKFCSKKLVNLVNRMPLLLSSFTNVLPPKIFHVYSI